MLDISNMCVKQLRQCHAGKTTNQIVCKETTNITRIQKTKHEMFSKTSSNTYNQGKALEILLTCTLITHSVEESGCLFWVFLGL